MKRRRKSTGFIAFAVFVVFIIVGGFALKAADYIDNPFDDIAFASQFANQGEGQFAGALGQNGDLPPLTTTGDSTFTAHSANGEDEDFAETSEQDDDLSPLTTSASSTGSGVDLTSLGDTNTQFQLPPPDAVAGASADTGAAFGGSDRENRIVWSDIGGVFYNLWFISAVTACFIVVQYIFKFSVKQIKYRLPAAAASR